MELKCAICGVRACQKEPEQRSFPPFCPMSSESPALDEARAVYTDPETRRLYLASARMVAAGYRRDTPDGPPYYTRTRVEEVMNLARRLDVTRLGIAFCGGLVREARILQEILEASEFEVFSVMCKTGSIPKDHIGLTDEEKIVPGRFEVMCNPVGQAKLLNAAETGLNVAVGLCVGHDSLFFQHSKAPVTVLVVKDRVTGHNPAAALYTAHSYYRRLRERGKE